MKTTYIYPKPVATLMTLGDVRQKKEWPDYLAMGFTTEHVPDLCRMMLDEELRWADSNSNEVWSGIHAWRAIAQLKAETAIPDLINLLNQHTDEDYDDWVQEELPIVFGHIGQPAIEPLRTYLMDPDHDQWARIAASSSFAKIGQHHPILRSVCITILTQQLEQFASQDSSFNAFIIGNLIDLKATEVVSVIEQAFAADQVDVTVQGDFEQVEIRLGLRTDRETPEPDYRALIKEQFGIGSSQVEASLNKVATQTKERQKAKAKLNRKMKAKAKSKRKQSKKAVNSNVNENKQLD